MMTILGIEVPADQRLWFWNAGGENGILLMAPDRAGAYAKAIAARLGSDAPSPENIANQELWFELNDTLVEVVGEYTGVGCVGLSHCDE